MVCPTRWYFIPFLFRFYIMDVVLKLAGIGYDYMYNIGGIFVNLSCYADDMVMITPSWFTLQCMFNVLETEAAAINMSCNSKKTACIVFSPINKRNINFLPLNWLVVI